MELTAYEADVLARLVAHHTTIEDERMGKLNDKLMGVIKLLNIPLGKPFMPSPNPDLYGNRPMINVDRAFAMKAKLTGTTYTEFQKYMAAYGFVSCPITVDEFQACRTLGLTVDDAYRLACDCNAGLEFGRALIPYLSAKHEERPDSGGYDGTYSMTFRDAPNPRR